MFVPYPQKYKVSFGVPGYCAFDQSFYAKSEIDCLFISPQVQKYLVGFFCKRLQATAERRKQVFGLSPINCPIQQKQHIILMRFFKIWGPQKILCTFGEKEHTSKRVSIILIMRFQTRSIRCVAGALHIRAKVPCGHRTSKLCFGFSTVHRLHKKITTVWSFFYTAPRIT